MRIIEAPMGCCGMLEAYGFSEFRYVMGLDGKTRYQPPTEDETQKYFMEIERAQRINKRNCVLISLSSSQELPLKVAKENGYSVILEFYNPNSGNQVYLLTKILWADRDEYRNDPDVGHAADDEEDDE